MSGSATMSTGFERLQQAIAQGDHAALAQALAEDPALAHARAADGSSALMLALYYRQPAMAAAIAEYRPLDFHEAVALGRLAPVAAELARKPELARAYAADGFSALALAVYFGQLPMAALLLAHGADVNAAARNAMRVAPIHAALTHPEAQALPLLHLLLAFGAAVDARQQQGWTALHSAVHRDQPQTIRALLLAGADPEQPADDGRSARAMAQAEGRTAALSALG